MYPFPVNEYIVIGKMDDGRAFAETVVCKPQFPGNAFGRTKEDFRVKLVKIAINTSVWASDGSSEWDLVSDSFDQVPSCEINIVINYLFLPPCKEKFTIAWHDQVGYVIE
jgi:hypothetical protein